MCFEDVFCVHEKEFESAMRLQCLLIITKLHHLTLDMEAMPNNNISL